MLDALKTIDVVFADKGDSLAVAIGTGCTTDAVNIVLAIAGHIVVDDHTNIVDIDTAGHNIGSYQHIGLSGLEAEHSFVALGLREVGVHLVAINMHRLELAGNLFYAILLAREDDDALQIAILKDVLDNLKLLRFVAHVGHLVNLLGRARHSNLYLDRIVEQLYGKFAYLLRHSGREHDALTILRQLLYYLHDVVDESHIEHTVGLVEHKEAAAREVEVAHLEVTEQSARCSNQHIGTHTHRAQFLIVAVAIVAAINGHTTYIVEIITKALHGLVYLLSEFASGRHDDAVDGILGIIAIVELRENRQQVGCRFTSSRLGYTQHIVAVQNLRDASLLNGRHIFEVHVVKRIENIIVQICFFECH